MCLFIVVIFHPQVGAGVGPLQGGLQLLGAKYCTLEINTSEITGFSVAFSNGLSVAFSNGISLFSGIFQRIVTFPVDFIENAQCMFRGIFQRNFTFVLSGVSSCAPSSRHGFHFAPGTAPGPGAMGTASGLPLSETI